MKTEKSAIIKSSDKKNLNRELSSDELIAYNKRRRLSLEHKMKIEINEQMREAREKLFKQRKEKEFKDMFKKIEDKKIKQIEISYNNLRKERIENMKRRLKLEELKEKDEKIKIFQQKKNLLNKQKLKIENHVNKENDQVLSKIIDLVSQKQNTNEELNMKEMKNLIKDEELIKKIQDMKNNKN
jgi:hypothetical protein